MAFLTFSWFFQILRHQRFLCNHWTEFNLAMLIFFCFLMSMMCRKKNLGPSYPIFICALDGLFTINRIWDIPVWIICKNFPRGHPRVKSLDHLELKSRWNRKNYTLKSWNLEIFLYFGNHEIIYVNSHWNLEIMKSWNLFQLIFMQQN